MGSTSGTTRTDCRREACATDPTDGLAAQWEHAALQWPNRPTTEAAAARMTRGFTLSSRPQPLFDSMTAQLVPAQTGTHWRLGHQQRTCLLGDQTNPHEGSRTLQRQTWRHGTLPWRLYHLFWGVPTSVPRSFFPHGHFCDLPLYRTSPQLVDPSPWRILGLPRSCRTMILISPLGWVRAEVQDAVQGPHHQGSTRE